MSLGIPDLALLLEVDGRTMRRAVERGAVHARRPSPRRIQLASGEVEYLLGHWGLLASLTGALRTEPGVRLAVLFGSAARGEDGPGSDIDILVDMRSAGGSRADLERRLAAAIDRPIDLARLEFVRESSPLLLLQAIDEGRVLVDREGGWSHLLAERDRVAGAARRAVVAEARDATEAYSQLIA